MKGLSIIIPCYKRKRELKKCLECLAQNKGIDKEFKYEILVIENSSKKELEKLVTKFKDLNLRYFWLQKKGISRAKNFGAKRAKYEILVFCDSDIELKEDVLLKTFSTFKNNPYAAMVSGKVFWQGTKKLDRPSLTDRFFKYKGFIFAECFYGRYMACLKKAFLKVGGFDDKLFNMRGEGVDLSTKFWRAGYPLVFNPKIQCYHKKEAPFSVSRKIEEKNLLMFRSMILHCYKYDGDLEKSPWRAKALNRWGRKLFGENLPYKILESAARSLNWFFENKKQILISKQEIPKIFDFKPEDIFSNKTLLLRCLKEAPKRVKAAK